jgi:DNA gyrase inhibitor GyrI
MPADEITQRHLQRLRIRGAPSTIPGTVGFVGTYDAEETWRQTARALVTPLNAGGGPRPPVDRPVTAARLKEAYARLAASAEQQKLTVVEEPLFALKGDPNEDPPHKWEYEAVLPIRGPGKAEEGISVTRIQGGMHIFSMTPRGLADLEHVYVFLFGKFLPSKKQQLMRPYILHRVVDGLEAGHDDALTIAVYVPAVLSIKPVPIPGEEGGEA